MFLKCKEKQSRCGNQKGAVFRITRRGLLLALSCCSSKILRGDDPQLFFPDVRDIAAITDSFSDQCQPC
jgi:hypothetical protein